MFGATLTFARAALCSDRLTFMVMMFTLFIDVMTQMMLLLMMLLMLWYCGAWTYCYRSCFCS